MSKPIKKIGKLLGLGKKKGDDEDDEARNVAVKRAKGRETSIKITPITKKTFVAKSPSNVSFLKYYDPTKPNLSKG